MFDISNRAREKLESGGLSLGIGIRITTSTSIARTMAAADFDWLFIDMEHGSLSIESCCQIATAALDSGIAPLVRVPPGQHWLAVRALEGGAVGILMADVKTPDQAQELVNITKFRPIGLRNVGGPPVHTAFKPQKADVLGEMYNRTTLTVAMLESPEGIGNADDIAAINGIDVLMFGGNDLSTMMELPGQTDHPDVIAAAVKLTDACKKHGKWAGMGGVMNNDHARKYLDLGVQFILAGSDTGLLAGAGQKRTEELRGLK